MPADDEVSSMKFAGSTVIVVAESRQAVVDALKDDIYVKSGVWDLEKVSFLFLVLLKGGAMLIMIYVGNDLAC